MCGYIVFYQGAKAEIYAENLHDAKKKAVELFRVPKKKQGLLAIVLAEKDGKPVTHSTTEL